MGEDKNGVQGRVWPKELSQRPVPETRLKVFLKIKKKEKKRINCVSMPLCQVRAKGQVLAGMNLTTLWELPCTSFYQKEAWHEPEE